MIKHFSRVQKTVNIKTSNYNLLHTLTLVAKPGINAVAESNKKPGDGFNSFPQKRSASIPVMGSRPLAMRRKSYRHVAVWGCVYCGSLINVPAAECVAAMVA